MTIIVNTGGARFPSPPRRDELDREAFNNLITPDGKEGTRLANKASLAQSFKVQADNITSGGTGEEFLKSVDFKPEPNPMGDLLQPTYHFSFYLDSDDPSEQGKGREFVIAETGLTGINIQDVQIETFVGANVRTRNATATSITMKVFEPYGAQLPDLLFQAAVRMNIRNYLKAPWFLRLKLWGYDMDGKVAQVGSSWTWKMVLIDIQSQISESGSVHTITAMPQAEVALNNQYCMLTSVVKANGSTVGEVLNSIIQDVNTHTSDSYGYTNGVPFLSFAVRDEPYPYDTKVGVSRPFDHQLTGASPQDGNQRLDRDFGLQTSQFSPGTDIPAVVDKLMARSNTAIQIARISRELPATSGPDTESEVRDVSSLLHRIDTQVEYLGYDSVMGDYAKKITFIVKPYQSLRLMTSMGRAMSFDREKYLNRRKAQHAVKQVMLCKQYDYLFTGLNTEVEKFDININFRWATQVPVMQGWTSNTGSTARVDNSLETAKNHSLQLPVMRARIDELQAKKIEADEAVEGETEEQTTLRAQRSQELAQQIAKAQEEFNQARSIATREKDQLNQTADDAAQRRRRFTPTARITNGEDDIYGNATGQSNTDQIYGGAGQGGQSVFPNTLVQDPEGTTNTFTGSSTDNNSNKSVYGAFLNQLYGSFDGNLASIELDIRGDPYWLGPGNVGQPYDQPSTGQTPNWMNGEHMFVFRFKLPQGYDQNTGTVSLAPDARDAVTGSTNVFTGFYATTTVTNHFREGRFTQTLNGVRIQGWTYENIIEGRDVTVDDDTVFSNSQAPRATTDPTRTGQPSSTGARNTSGMDERTLLAMTLYGEARGEGYEGMQAVGNVIMNRTRQRYRGGSVSEVILSRSQFSIHNNGTGWTNGVNTNNPSYQQAYEIAGQLLSGQARDLTGGATHYYAYKKVKPSWAGKGTKTATIGNHVFYKGVP